MNPKFDLSLFLTDPMPWVRDALKSSRLTDMPKNRAERRRLSADRRKLRKEKTPGLRYTATNSHDVSTDTNFFHLFDSSFENFYWIDESQTVDTEPLRGFRVEHAILDDFQNVPSF